MVKAKCRRCGTVVDSDSLRFHWEAEHGEEFAAILGMLWNIDQKLVTWLEVVEEAGKEDPVTVRIPPKMEIPRAA